MTNAASCEEYRLGGSTVIVSIASYGVFLGWPANLLTMPQREAFQCLPNPNDKYQRPRAAHFPYNESDALVSDL